MFACPSKLYPIHEASPFKAKVKGTLGVVKTFWFSGDRIPMLLGEGERGGGEVEGEAAEATAKWTVSEAPAFPAVSFA
jgi:hypothetical protein